MAVEPVVSCRRATGSAPEFVTLSIDRSCASILDLSTGEWRRLFYWTRIV